MCGEGSAGSASARVLVRASARRGSLVPIHDASLSPATGSARGCARRARGSLGSSSSAAVRSARRLSASRPTAPPRTASCTRGVEMQAREREKTLLVYFVRHTTRRQPLTACAPTPPPPPHTHPRSRARRPLLGEREPPGDVGDEEGDGEEEHVVAVGMEEGWREGGGGEGQHWGSGTRAAGGRAGRTWRVGRAARGDVKGLRRGGVGRRERARRKNEEGRGEKEARAGGADGEERGRTSAVTARPTWCRARSSWPASSGSVGAGDGAVVSLSIALHEQSRAKGG